MKRKDIIKIILGGVGVCLISTYIYGVNFYKKNYYPNTKIKGFGCKNLNAKEVESVIKADNKKYSIIVKTQDGSITIENKNEELRKTENVSKDLKEILKSQNAFLWPIQMHKEYKYNNIGSYIISKETIETELNSVLNPEEKIKSENAKLKYDPETKQYGIIEDTIGNIVNKEKTIEKVYSSAVAQETEVDINDCYKKAKIRKDNKKFLKAKDKLDKYLSCTVKYTRGDRSLVLDADKIHDFLCWDKNFKTWINESAVEEYVKEKVAGKFTTMGDKRSIKSPGSGNITISGGNYGYVVSIANEKEELLKNIKSGETTEREPKYYQTARSSEGSEIGDTYIDVSIADQEVWYIKNGKVKMHSDCVTGNPSNGHATPKGVYYVEFKTTNYTFKRYNSHADYWMPIDTSTGVGLHDASWRSEFGGSVYKGNGSHGCINLPSSFARKLYGVVEEGLNHGTPVIVH